MSAQPKKILILFAAGGSLLSIKGNRSVFFVETKDSVKEWLSHVPEVSILADITSWYGQGEYAEFKFETITKTLMHIDSTENNYDGYVVIVRAEYLLEFSIAAEYMLQGFSKPIIFIGSRFSPEAIAEQDIKKIMKMGGLGLRSNLVNAVQIASSKDFPATAIMYGNRLIKPTKAQYATFFGVNLFKSVDDDYLGKVDFGITLYRGKIQEYERQSLLALSPKIHVIGHGLLDYTLPSVLKIKDTDKDVILIHIRENQVIPTNTLQSLKRIFKSIVLYNEHYVLQHHGVIALTRLTWISVLMKVHWVRAQANDIGQFEQLITENYINEAILR